MKTLLQINTTLNYGSTGRIAEEIGLLAGFSSRQAFYLAFSRVYDITPRAYRLGLKP